MSVGLRQQLYEFCWTMLAVIGLGVLTYLLAAIQNLGEALFGLVVGPLQEAVIGVKGICQHRDGLLQAVQLILYLGEFSWRTCSP